MFLNKQKKKKQCSGLEAVFRKNLIDPYPAADPNIDTYRLKMFKKIIITFNKIKNSTVPVPYQFMDRCSLVLW